MREQKIRDALDWAISHNYKINYGGVIFIWEEDKIVSCDAIGAILLFNGISKSSGWIKFVSDYLEVDNFWLYRFNMGFDRNFQILIEHEGKKVSYSEDEVSKLGIKFLKEYVKCQPNVR